MCVVCGGGVCGGESVFERSGRGVRAKRRGDGEVRYGL